MEPYIGEIRMFAGDFAPRGWALCDGKLLSINQYHALFSLIQTYYGGDGMSTFAVPDLRGRAPINAGASTAVTSAYGLGQQNGVETIKLNQQQLPAHSHLINSVSKAANHEIPTNFYPASPVDRVEAAELNFYSDETPDVQLNPGTISSTGSNAAVAIVQPVLAVTFIIALEGIYPPRP